MMAKWNWLKGLGCVAGLGAMLLTSGAVKADDAAAGSAPACNYDQAMACEEECGGSLFNCDGDPWELFGTTDKGLHVGGWAQVGYSSAATEFNNTFQDRRVLLNQGWLFMEKLAESECGEWAWGYRADFVYGADATNTQSFGNNPGQFDLDSGFQHGDRAAWAIPQLYAEISNGDWTIKGGHFYTLHGYEVVQATGNFFFSHAYTMNYAEPFTHTGVVVTHQMSENTKLYAGWTAGFDTGFDQRAGGSNFMGGYSTSLTDDITLTQIVSLGDFGANFVSPISGIAPDEDGSIAISTVIDYAVTEKLKYVFHSDLLRTGVYDTFGVNQYLIYQLTDCVGVGTRAEWWKADGASVNAITWGLNVKPHTNLTIRPEYRYDWSPSGNTNRGIQGGFVDQSHGTFAIDAVFTF